MKNYIITHNGLFLFQLETKHGATFTNSSSIAKKFTKEEMGLGRCNACVNIVFYNDINR